MMIYWNWNVITLTFFLIKFFSLYYFVFQYFSPYTYIYKMDIIYVNTIVCITKVLYHEQDIMQGQFLNGVNLV